MTKFTIYDATTNEITCVFEGRETDAALNGSYIEGEYSAKEYTVVNGQAVRKNDADILQAETDRAWIVFRNRRNGMLTDSDWTQSLDSPLTDSKKTEWATYRQNLRDLPGIVSDPSNASFPDKPD
jgi:hypothetical protein